MTTLASLILTSTITVQVLAKHELAAVEVFQDGRWVEICAPLDEKITLREPELRSAGRFRRSYSGSVDVSSCGGKLFFLNTVKEEDYLQGVLAGEAEAGSLEALKALAIAARSMIPFLAGRHDVGRLCDLTHCQVYAGRTDSTAIREAVRSTEGRILLYRGEPALAPYHSTCGGSTAPPNGFFETRAAYLRGVRDAGLCSMSPHYRWETALDSSTLGRIIGLQTPPLELQVDAIGPAGRVLFISANGQRLSGAEFHRRAGRELGWNAVKSTWFTLERQGERFRVRGRGLGHGVGLCQWGAEAMAKQGRIAEEILSFYFPGTEVGRSGGTRR